MWLVVACRDDGAGLVTTPPPEDPTFGSSGSTSVTASTGESGGAEASDTGDVPCGPGRGACAADTFCSAPVVGSTPTPGEFVCGACLEPEDPLRWCLDATSCCDPAAVCDNGFCRGDAITSEASSSGSGSSDTGASSSDSSGGSSESGGSETSSSSGDPTDSTSSGDASSSSSDSTGA